MQPTERNPAFANKLIHSASPYLRQHAHNPVFWYPWGREAIERARTENKPILLSIGYSTCYWCHVMEREVFENLSIASLMNRCFINIKVDREEHPEIDEIYMVARQLMTHEGGWPNNVFLTPDLKPFYAGGTYAPDEAYNKPAFPRLVEWLHYSWTTQEEVVRGTAEDTLKIMRPYLLYAPKAAVGKADARARADELFAMLKGYYDERSGGFFQAPKFPHENYLQFLLGYHEATGERTALDMATRTLEKMAAGGIYDHVGCGFHRYAVDKEWYVPHFEKMLYNQSQLARAYTDAARLTQSEYLADIAKSILDFTSGPFTDGSGGFYAAIDAETDAVEGEYYAWTSQELEEILSPEEVRFFVEFYALADIPAFPGHKHTSGQVIIARKPLAEAARERHVPYVQLAASAAEIMNKLLLARNKRQSPGLDDKIIVGWNGLMIDAYAHAGKVFGIERYITIARRAADFLLEHAIDNEGRLCRIAAAGKPRLRATLEDYACLAKGLLSLYSASNDAAMLDAALSIMTQAEEKFSDAKAPGYFSAEPDDLLPVRIKSNDDSALTNPNAVMLGNWVTLFEITHEALYRDKAQAMVDYFLPDGSAVMVEAAGMLRGAQALSLLLEGKKPGNALFIAQSPDTPGQAVKISAALFPPDAKPGENCEMLLTFDIEEGWHINADRLDDPLLLPTRVEVQGEGVSVVDIVYPPPLRLKGEGDALLPVYQGRITVTARLHLARGMARRPLIRAMIRFQPCREGLCHPASDVFISV